MRALLIALALFAFAPKAQAIIWCHDYAMFRLTGVDPRPITWPGLYGTDISELRAWLTANGYKRYDYTNAIQDPDRAGKFLKPGYVIILKDDHSGFVNNSGLIDHFIQVQGEVGKKRNHNELPLFDPNSGRVGGLYLHETLRDFLSRPFNQENMTAEVWRR